MFESIVRIGTESIIIVFRRQRTLQRLGTGTYRTLRGSDGRMRLMIFVWLAGSVATPHVRTTTLDPVACQNWVSYP
ncbi:MAG: hypothetical protein QF569_07760 [Candidatus Poribacteria bacterium]|nr:hypothetical protein [Candidatus Poribacteria bacterium]